jgi:L-ascorbate metabolism protein UlaG (beta-lactamase superfamily)
VSASVLIDPPHPEVGYPIKEGSVPAEIVFVSHEHPDHNWDAAAQNPHKLVAPLTKPGYESGKYTYPGEDPAEGLSFQRIFSYHDNEQGTLRGTNTITVFSSNGLRICHLGDLGQLKLTPKQLELIGHVDILMIPVGGYYTIDGKQAVAIVEQLRPRVILPMHYRTPALNADLQSKLHPLDEFLSAMKGKAQVINPGSKSLSFTRSSLPAKPTIYVLKYQ